MQGPGDGRPSQGKRLVSDLSTRQLSDGFLAWKAATCLPNTVRKYQWALGCLERAYPILPRVTVDLIRFVENEPLSHHSKGNLWDTVRDFYRWIKDTQDPLTPVLPPINFGRRRAGEKRGRQSSA